MTGTLFLKPAMRRGHLPDLNALFLTQGMGLCHVDGWKVQGFLIADDPADYGIDGTLSDRIAAWTAPYRTLQQGLYPPWTPEHCRDLDIQSHNREGLTIAQLVAAALPEQRHLVFRPIKRKGAYFHSWIVEGWSHQAHMKLPHDLGGPPVPAYYEDARDPHKWVRVMGDYGSSGIWHWEGYEMDPDDLPVPDDLKAKLADWALRYFSWTDSWHDGASDNFARIQDDDRELRIYSDEGLAIARAIKGALQEWTVVYFDEELSGRHAIRAKYQFEIT